MKTRGLNAEEADAASPGIVRRHASTELSEDMKSYARVMPLYLGSLSSHKLLFFPLAILSTGKKAGY